jgi:hypothetical protein
MPIWKTLRAFSPPRRAERSDEYFPAMMESDWLLSRGRSFPFPTRQPPASNTNSFFRADCEYRQHMTSEPNACKIALCCAGRPARCRSRGTKDTRLHHKTSSPHACGQSVNNGCAVTRCLSSNNLLIACSPTATSFGFYFLMVNHNWFV